MRKKKKKLDEVFEGYSFSDANIASLFFREDAIKHNEGQRKKQKEEGLESVFSEDTVTLSAEDQTDTADTVVSEEAIPEEEPTEEAIEEVVPEEEPTEEAIDEEISEEEPIEEAIEEVVPEEEPIEEATEETIEEAVPEEEPTEEAIEEVVPEEEPIEEAIDEEIPEEEPIEEAIEEVVPEEEPTEEAIEEVVPEEEPTEEAIEEESAEEDPEVLAALIAEAILSDTDVHFTPQEEKVPEVTAKEDIESPENAKKAPDSFEKSENAQASEIKESKPKKEKVEKAPREKKPRIKPEKAQKEKKVTVFVMGDADIPEDSRLPSRIVRRKYGKARSFVFMFTLLALVAAASFAIFYTYISNLTGIYVKADPDLVVEQCMEYISGNRLYNDIVLGVGIHKTEYESEKNASGTVLDKLHEDTEKNYIRVYSGEDVLSYDIYSGTIKIYNVVLEKKAAARPIFNISALELSFWEVKDITFYSESLSEYKKKIYISAPKDASLYLNGVPLTEEMITDSDYSFFVGSVWESNVPAEARCVLYCIDGIFGEPVFSAYHGEEKLDIYADEQGVYHAKYPKDWVKDYSVFVPKGAILYVNGVLATKISSTGSAPATVFEQEAAGLTDIYVLESLFNDPTLHAYFNAVSLGEPSREEDAYSFAFGDDMYHKAEITVPKGAKVKVNGVLLDAGNSVLTDVQFSEWSKYRLNINSYMPSELKNAGFDMPSFEKYTVSMLYSAPSVEVSVNGTVCTPYEEEKQAGQSRFIYDFPTVAPESSFTVFAETFAKTYLKYVTEGCYGIRDDIEMRKNFYTNWINYLSYILPDTLCYDSALESYSDVEYRPNLSIISQSYTVQNVIKYSDSIYSCSIVCSVKDSGSDSEIISVINMTIVISSGQYKVWMHDTIS
ncbi:MAG: hypothetical protein IIX97_05410 [Clostridia bacterium]|nr:hypothetical protein [Clostridia bacterium]